MTDSPFRLPFEPDDDPSTVATLEDPCLAARSALARLADDPWSVTERERLELRAAHRHHQARWAGRIAALVEPPAIDDTFPAFLLSTRPFARLAKAIGDARTPGDLDTGTADELQRFVDRYRDYLPASADPVS